MSRVDLAASTQGGLRSIVFRNPLKFTDLYCVLLHEEREYENLSLITDIVYECHLKNTRHAVLIDAEH